MSTDSSTQPSDGNATPTALEEQAALIATQLVEIGKLKEQVSELKTELDDYLARMQPAVEKAETDAESAVAAKQDIEAAREAIATARSLAAAELQATVDAHQGALSTVSAITTARQEFDAQTAAIVAALPTTQANIQAIQGFLATVSSHGEEAARLVREIHSKLPELERVGAIIGTHEAALQGTVLRYEETFNKIENLLPGATGAGLGEAFHKQRDRFNMPARLWAAVFVATMVALVVVAYVGSDKLLSDAVGSWSAIGVYMVRRLPFYVPLVWLAIYAGMQHMLAQRLEEDYAYKESISRAFEGYKNQMSNPALQDMNPSPLGVLCTNVLQMLAQEPGRIYDKNVNANTPLGVVVDALPKIQKALAKSMPKEVHASFLDSFGDFFKKIATMLQSRPPAEPPAK
jgi:polyhydroxyalkanoate synthesis regulator phasin